MESDDLRRVSGLPHKELFVNALPPSSLAITSALPSSVTWEMEELEFPKEIPMTWRDGSW